MRSIAVDEIRNSRNPMRPGKAFVFHRKSQGQESALCSKEHGDRFAPVSEGQCLGYPPLNLGKKKGIRVGEKAQSLLRRFRRQETHTSCSMYPVVAHANVNLGGGIVSNQDLYASSIDTEDSGNICGHPIYDSARLLEARERFAMLKDQMRAEGVDDTEWCDSVSVSEDETETAAPSAVIENLQGPRIEEPARAGFPKPLLLAVSPASGAVPAELELVTEQRVGSYFLAANWLPTLTQSTESSCIPTIPEDDNSLEYSYRYEEPVPNGCCLLPHPYFHDYF